VTSEDITAAAVASLTTNPPAAPPADTPTDSGKVEATPDVTVDSSTTQDTTADAAAQVQDGEEQAAQPQPNKPSRGVQKRIDELVRDREHERRRADQAFELLARSGINPNAPVAPQAERLPTTTDEPRPDQFQTYEAYLDARTDWRWKQNQEQARKADTEAAERRKVEEAGRRIAKAEQAAASKYEDYEDVVATVKADDFPGTRAMFEYIAESDSGGDLLYWLGSHRDEAERISRLSPVLQARELTRVEASLGTPPPAPRNRPSAPPPPRTLTGGGAPTQSLTTMSFSDLRKTVAGWQRK
jgi:hypothetical protein